MFCGRPVTKPNSSPIQTRSSSRNSSTKTYRNLLAIVEIKRLPKIIFYFYYYCKIKLLQYYLASTRPFGISRETHTKVTVVKVQKQNHYGYSKLISTYCILRITPEFFMQLYLFSINTKHNLTKNL